MPFNQAFSSNSVRHPCAPKCPSRTPGCGATCEKWQKYMAERNETYRQREQRCHDYTRTASGAARFNKAPKK